MANWKYTLEVKDAWQATKDGKMTIAQFAAHAAEKIKALPVFGADREIEEIVEELEIIATDPEPDVEEFDGVWSQLYDWADQVVGGWSDKRHTPPQYPPYPPIPWPMYPERRGGSVVATVSTVLMAIAALVMVGLFAWKVTGGVLPSMPSIAAQPTRAALPGYVTPRSDTGGGVQTDIDAYNAGQQATAAAAAAIQAQHPAQAPAVQAPALPNGIPTAVILIPTALPIEQVTVVPDANKPLVFAAGSDVRPTPVTVMPYPTPLPRAIADNFEVSPDGTCITAPRGGKRYQVCQGWKYAPNELATVADLIRGGTLLGVEVQ